MIADLVQVVTVSVIVVVAGVRVENAETYGLMGDLVIIIDTTIETIIKIDQKLTITNGANMNLQIFTQMLFVTIVKNGVT